MQPRKWKFRITHILHAMEKIRNYTSGMDFDAFKSEEKTVDAVLNNFMIIGEATRYLPEEIQQRYPEAQWALMRGMRNTLVHAYDRVDMRTVWDTIQEDIEPLIPILQRILDQEQD